MITMTSAFDMVESRWYFLLLTGFSVYFAIIASKNLQKSSAIQNISVTLSSVIIAIIVCNVLIFNTLKLQQFSLITKFFNNYNSSNSRYIIIDFNNVQQQVLDLFVTYLTDLDTFLCILRYIIM